ncbi:MAG TPA: hypothetical protein VEI96_07305 [Thermodesulfovibrionales bacterium]|nr:hypothetical protein [Thermodesulfovibrionales bacterium]
MNTDKRWRIVFLILSLLVVTAWLLWPSDESRIRRTLKEEVKAMEAGDVDGVMAKISYAYHDEYGMSYLTLGEELKRQLKTLSDITVEYEDLMIRVEDGEATAEFMLRVIATKGNETGYIIGDVKTPLRLRLVLRKEHGRWLIAETKSLSSVRTSPASALGDEPAGRP